MGMQFRVGVGVDVHPWVRGRKLYLGGVEIPYTQGLAGHSDGDVLLHALMDALLGGMGLGDIGEYFPPSDERYRGISSLFLLEVVRDKIKEKGGEVVNIDAVVLLEKPHLAPYKEKMKETIAQVLGMEKERINIKAGTCEKLGFVGREEGVVSIVTVLLKVK